MDVFEAIEKRRCVRRFDQTKSVSEVQIEKLLEAANWAPSAGNLQSYLIVIVKKDDIKRRLAVAALRQGFVEEASVVFVFCADRLRSASRYGVRGEKLYAVQDATIAAQNTFLAATGMGLGACWVGAFREEKVKQVLSLEKNLRPVVIMPVGYPARFPKKRSRRKISAISRKI